MAVVSHLEQIPAYRFQLNDRTVVDALSMPICDGHMHGAYED